MSFSLLLSTNIYQNAIDIKEMFHKLLKPYCRKRLIFCQQRCFKIPTHSKVTNYQLGLITTTFTTTGQKTIPLHRCAKFRISFMLASSKLIFFPSKRCIESVSASTWRCKFSSKHYCSGEEATPRPSAMPQSIAIPLMEMFDVAPISRLHFKYSMHWSRHFVDRLLYKYRSRIYIFVNKFSNKLSASVSHKT